jgi:ADP-heptose:LPS heptosyltransferase
LARGKYLQFLDADDLLLPEKIERQVRQLESNAFPAISACDYRYFDGGAIDHVYGGDVFKGQFPLQDCEQIFLFETVIHRWLIPAALFEQAGGFDETPSVIGTEDWLLLWRLSAAGISFLFLDEPLVLYRKHVGTLTCNFARIGSAHLGVIGSVERYQKQTGRDIYSRRQLNQLRETYHYEIGLELVRAGRAWRACRELITASFLASNRRQSKLLLILLVPILRGRAIDVARVADDKLWQLRASLRKLFSRGLMSTPRQSFYEWRQRRPLKRGAAAAALLIMGPTVIGGRRILRLFSRRTNVQRVLVFHFGGLGDTLMLTPALRALKQHYPDAKLDIITLHESVKNSFAQQQCIDSIESLPPYPGKWIISRFAGRTGGRLILATLRYYPELLLRLLFRRYDIVINFGLCEFDQTLGNALAYCQGVGTRVGARGKSGELLTHQVETNLSTQHRVDTYLEFLKPLRVRTEDKTYEYPIGDLETARAKFVLRERGINATRRLAVIHPGGKLHVNSRRWPAEYFARVCEYLFNEGFEVVLTGDRDDVEVCAEVERACDAGIKSLTGALTFAESAALLSIADLVITNDTATLHLAEAAAAARIVSIFGPTDPSLLAPRNSRHLVFRSNLPCAPCMGGTIDANTERCWREVKEECLWQTTPAQVIAELRQLYATRASRVATA